MTTKTKFLARLRAAEPGSVAPHRPVAPLDEVPEVVLADEPPADADLVEVFATALGRLGGHVHRATAAEVPATVAAVIGDRGPVLVDERSLDFTAGLEPLRWPSCGLDAAAGAAVGVLPARAAAATTGSVVVDSDLAGRLVSLLPSMAVLVVPASTVVRRLGDVLRYPERWWPGGMPTNVIVLTGPSRSADIEMYLVVDVHGPGEVHVVVIDDA